MKTNLPESKYLFDDRTPMAFQAVLCLIQGGDDGLPAFSAFQKINGGRYLWQHGGEFKLALADIIPVSYTHMTLPTNREVLVSGVGV